MTLPLTSHKGSGQRCIKMVNLTPAILKILLIWPRSFSITPEVSRHEGHTASREVSGEPEKRVIAGDVYSGFRMPNRIVRSMSVVRFPDDGRPDEL